MRKKLSVFMVAVTAFALHTTTLTSAFTGSEFNIATVTEDTEPPRPFATLTVNGKPDAVVAYGSSVEVKWTSEQLSTCMLTPGGNTGTSGQVLLAAKNSLHLALECSGDNGNFYQQAFLEVQPPTFAYLKTYLQSLNKQSQKPRLDTDDLLEQVDQARKEHKQGRVSKAEARLTKTTTSLNKLVSKKKAANQVATNYSDAVTALIKSWTPSVYGLTLSQDGCDIKATAPAGYVLVHGSHSPDWRRGGELVSTIPEAGVLEVSTGVRSGDIIYAYLKDQNDTFLTYKTGVVGAEDCPYTEVEEPSGPGGYPLSLYEAPYATVVDNWGMLNQTAESYAAFKINESGSYMPYWGMGVSANQWDDKALGAGIAVDSTPQPGDVAVMNVGTYGHVMYVESVNTDGTINISQYDVASDGEYSTQDNVSTGKLMFIHFTPLEN